MSLGQWQRTLEQRPDYGNGQAAVYRRRSAKGRAKLAARRRGGK